MEVYDERRTSVPSKEADSASAEHIRSDDKPPLQPEEPSRPLPPPLQSLTTSILSTLKTTFPKSPPHTAQRLAELLLYPTRHYRTLPSYLRALDRIVSVASPANVFPLPNIQPNGPLSNGIASLPPSPPEDEAGFRGGAVLTEIPWLRDSQTAETGPIGRQEASTINSNPSGAANSGARNGNASDLRTESTSVIDGPNGAGSVETVVVNMNGISHRNAGTNTMQPSPSVSYRDVDTRKVADENSGTSATSGEATPGSIALDQESATVIEETSTAESENEEKALRARGPEEIGMEDMGPQASHGDNALSRGLDVEGALGRRGEATLTATPHDKVTETGNANTAAASGGTGDADDDFVLVDADGEIQKESDVSADANREAGASIDI